MPNTLYNFIIRPLYLLFEFIFVKAYILTQNYGLTIICLSITINFLILPLYKRADAIQAENREKEKKLEYWANHIKKTFKGDERYMMLTTYYRQNDYRQTDSLKSSISLLLQIPFFIAAYRFLSSVQQLKGVSFGPIADLGAPDGMLTLAGITINVLPVLMTVINILSGSVYGKDLPIKSKIQMYGIAAVFLLLLYRSPSGLVFYWTLNNVFSLIKNLITKSAYKNEILAILSFSGAGALLSVFLVLYPAQTIRRRLLIFLLVAVLVYFGIYFLAKRFVPKKQSEKEYVKPARLYYILPAVYLTILVGVLIPSAVVSSSPAEFIDQTNYQNPLVYVFSTTVIAAGVFLCWMSVFYLLASVRAKQIFVCVLWILSGLTTINYMFFGRGLGNLSAQLVFDEEPMYSEVQQLKNLAILVVIAAILLLLIVKVKKIVPALYLAMTAGVICLSFMNINSTQVQLGKMVNYLKENVTKEAEIPLSKNGNNVVVLMLDRCINAYIPYLFQEDPDLKTQFEGFVYYPNTVSLGTSTNTGSAPLFGGYEYSPYEMNLRPEDTLEAKHNEALKVLPVLFSQNGFKSSVYDPPYAGYTWIPDLSIYDDYPEIDAYHTIGKFDVEIKEANKNLLQRNFFCYSIFKVMPLAFQKLIYDKGNYNNTTDLRADYTEDFMDSYTVLTNLRNMTKIQETGSTFMIMENKTTHFPCELQLPEYEPAVHVNNGTYDADHADRFTLDGVTMLEDTAFRRTHYYACMAAMRQIGLWFDYLRENGIYDNTRIIIVSDHGFGLGQFGEMYTEDGFDTEWFDPILMVKDFNSDGFQVSEEFMTHADVPALCTDGLIMEAVNPFSGKDLTKNDKENGVIVFHTGRWGVNDNNGNKFVEDEDNRWFTVSKDRRDMKNWRLIDNPTE